MAVGGGGQFVWAADGLCMRRSLGSVRGPTKAARMIMERGVGWWRRRGWVRADPRSAAFYCSTPKGFIMPFVITLTAVNTGESFYVPDQCERFGPVINQGRNLLWSNLTLFIKDNSRAPLKCHTIYL